MRPVSPYESLAEQAESVSRCEPSVEKIQTTSKKKKNKLKDSHAPKDQLKNIKGTVSNRGVVLIFQSQKPE